MLGGGDALTSTERPLVAVALGALFVLLAILNSGGYRYGASDQAFYVPAMMRQADPTLFPRDRALLAAQDELMVADELIARLSVIAGVPLVDLLFAAYLLMLLAIAGASWLFARTLFTSPWTAAALVLAMTIRHRVPKTGVNTLEHYFQPRMLAFAAGVLALTALVRRRTWIAVALAAVAGVLHPTTGVWFGIVIVAGGFVSDRAARPWLGGLVAAGLVAAALALAVGPMRARLVIMDAEWLAILASKDYLFPTDWRLDVWLQHLLYVVVVAVAFRARRARGLAGPGEAGLVAGLAVLLAVAVASLPFIHARLALAVQLQVSRAMWLFDFVAVAYVAWWLVEAAWRRGGAAPRRWVVALVLVLAAARGSYVMFVERAGNPVLQVDLRQDDWRAAMDWIARQPVDAHVLADPGHAWRFGSSVRLAARRDLYLEEVKDAALAMYSRDTAMRVLERTRALGDFNQLTPEHARTLARTYDLDFLVTQAALDLPLAAEHGRFRIYRLSPEDPARP